MSPYFNYFQSLERLIVKKLVVLLCLLAISVCTLSAEKSVFQFTYSAEVGPIEADSGPVHVFIPLPVANPQQRILQETINATIQGRVDVEDKYGNRYWHGSIEPKHDDVTISVNMDFIVERSSDSPNLLVNENESENAEQQAADLGKYLSANERVIVGAPILDPIRAEIHEKVQSDDKAAIARGIYDWVVENVEYKKVGTGWGNGDTYWACNERYGNCTDFHSLFISLARSEGIPARFEMGFPVPEERSSGVITGYHCWVQFYLPETGWFPIDASEAFKHPELKEDFYGTHPTNRIHFSTGRDLKLGESHNSASLNYFIYPHVEVAGTPYKGAVSRKFSFKRIGGNLVPVE